MFILLLLAHGVVSSLEFTNQATHFPLHRRGGRFSEHMPVNLTTLTGQLRTAEQRYSRTYRSIENNHLVRRWNVEDDDSAMLRGMVSNGGWYTTIHIGSPLQALEVDIDMLNPDFYTLLTTSGAGSKLNTFASQSHESSISYVHPLCRLSTDHLGVPGSQLAIPLSWPICQPSKSSRHTLANSGTVLGLAPNSASHPSSLTRLTSVSFPHLLYQKSTIQSSIWSITILDGSTGVLSIGGSLAAEFEESKARTEAELKYIENDNARELIEEEVKSKMAFAIPSGTTTEDHFKWIDVSGPSGWWTGLMSAIFVDGVKILKNQPFLIDVSCPFILAPPTAYTQLYSSISGAKPLSSHTLHPDDGPASTLSEPFHTFPCLNPPKIAFELAGWPFPIAPATQMTHEDAIHGPAGGAFSLGKVEESLTQDGSGTLAKTGVNTGFCVGIIVKSDMGERNEKQWKNSGMKDVWVLGEPFFRGLGVVFDDGEMRDGMARIGFRIY